MFKRMKLTPSKINLSWLLSFLIIVIVVFELYLAYVYLYPNLNVTEEVVLTKNIVRVDLKSYDSTINLLDELESFVGSPVNITNTNPFR